MSFLPDLPDLRRAPRLPAVEPARHPAQRGTPQRTVERQFAAMESVYVRQGGLATGDAVARLLRGPQPLSTLARWIVDRRIVSFSWQSRILVPLFQFEPTTLQPRPGVLDAVAELSPVLDDWALAAWFAEPNAWLGNRRPIDVVVDDPAEVLEAARADRQIVRW